MRIGMGGSAASSMATGSNAASLDFDSVQRGNPEIERRAQEVINQCWQAGANNPILAIHDVGAGGLSNAFPELVNDAGRGARFDLRAVPLEESGLAPKEIWCNESQERYVMAIAPESLDAFKAICERERCPFSVVGVTTDEKQLVLADEGSESPVDMPMNVLARQTTKNDPRRQNRQTPDPRSESDRRGPAKSRHRRAWRTRPSPASASSSPLATAPWAVSPTATRWSARGKCPWPIAP